MDVADRVVGSVLGLALGDALGAPFEFSRAGEVPDPIPALERPWMDLPPGSTTDEPPWPGTWYGAWPLGVGSTRGTW